MSADLPLLPPSIDLTRLEALKGGTMPAPKDIDIGFFSHRGRKSTQLIGNEFEQNFIKARREWMEFDFIEMIYVTSLVVYATGYEDYHELELSYEDFLSRSVNIQKSKYDNGAFHFKLNSFIGGFGLRPNERWFRDSKLTSITVEGVEQRSFAEVIAVMTQINAEVARVEANLGQYLSKAQAAEKKNLDLESQIATLEAEIEQKESSIETLSVNIQQGTSELDAIKKQIAIYDSVKKNVDTQIQESNNTIARLNTSSENLAKEIQEREYRLRSLKNDINLFPTEISGYVKQGAKNVSMYAWLGVIPLLVIVIVTARLFINSEKILGYDIDGDSNIIEFLISRIPYVVVSFAILAICYTLLNRLITEIIGINRRRQDLFKISIIATDVAYASQDGLSLSDEEAYNLKTETKMELLKEHLRQHIGEEFVYNPKGNLLHRISALVSRQVSDENSEQEKE